MKRIISLFLITVIFSACASAVSAQEGITAEEVDRIRAKHALINYPDDYKVLSYGAGGGTVWDYNDPEHEYWVEYMDPEDAYLWYRIKGSDDTMINMSGSAPAKNYFTGKDHEEITVKSGLSLSDSEGGHTYFFRDKKNEHAGGEFNISGKTAVVGGPVNFFYNAQSLFFESDDLARVINENGIVNVTEILPVANFFYRYMNDVQNVIDPDMIYIKADGAEYVITDVRYINGALDYYALLDKEAFVRAMQYDYSAAAKEARDKFNVKQPPVFSDIADDSAVSLLSRLGIISGYEDGTFGGDNNITRAEAAKMVASMCALSLYRYFEPVSKEESDRKNIFTDVEYDHWALPYIRYGSETGYISGEPDGQKLMKSSVIASFAGDIAGDRKTQGFDEYYDAFAFRPENLVTEQELAKMIVCAIDKFAEDMASAEGGWPEGYVAVAKRLGICADASDAPASRYTAAHMIKNALDASVTTDYGRIHRASVISEEETVGYESIYEKNIFFNHDYTAKRVRLTGKITEAVSEKEYRVVLGDDAKSFIGNYNAGDEVTALSRYTGMDGLLGSDCILYCELLGSNLVCCYAQPL